MQISALLIPVVAAQCVLYGNCGPASRFGTNLPCVNYTDPAPLLNPEAQLLLTQMCGAELAQQAVCCDADQVQELANNLKRVEPLLGSCPACQQNFFDVFCQFSCSPRQREFIEIISNRTTLSGNSAPAELNYYLDERLAAQTFNSCTNVKFSATNGRALDLVGGGAQDYPEFFKFLGDEKPMLGGSAFQINFPWENETENDLTPDVNSHTDVSGLTESEYSLLPGGFRRQNESIGYSCGMGELKCSCIDCEDACPIPSNEDLPSDSNEMCRLGFWTVRCRGLVSWFGVALYLGLTLIIGYSWTAERKLERTQSALEIQRLIEDDEHDEDDPFSLPSSELGSLNLRPYRLNSFISSWLGRQARFCAKYPWLITALCALFVLCASLGLIGIQLETDPIKLWVAPDSPEALQRNFFNSQFDGGFYRTAQIFVKNVTGPVLGPAPTNGDFDMAFETLQWLRDVEARVHKLQTPVLWDSLDSFCLKPVGDSCVVESVSAWSLTNRATWRRRLQNCASQPVNCLPSFQQPIDPNIVFGVDANWNSSVVEHIWDSTALVTTWVLRNSEDPVYLHRIGEWEELVETFFKTTVTEEAKTLGLNVSFNVESSMERELERSGQTDAKIVIFSYLAMFAYVSLSLGDSIWLGLVGILVVISSVTSAIGLLSLGGLHLTLIITEVIPFLALAIGVDNIFLIVHQIAIVSEVYPGLLTMEDQVAAAIGNIGPSIVMSTSCEVAALGIAALVKMPAVRNFAIFACVTVFINSVLQLTLFVSLLVLHKKWTMTRSTTFSDGVGSFNLLNWRSDSRSQQNSAANLTPATNQANNNAGTSVNGPQGNFNPTGYSSGGSHSVINGSITGNAGSSSNPGTMRSNSSVTSRSVLNELQVLDTQGTQTDPRRFAFFIGSRYTPFLLSRRTKQVVLAFFLFWGAISVYLGNHIDLGLDQRLAVPDDSFLVPYFSDVYNLLGVGPPAYYVVTFDDEHPAEDRDIQQRLCSRFSACDTHSVVNMLEMERKYPELSWIATAPASWIDDFLMWLNPALDACCVDPETGRACYAQRRWGFDMSGFPEDEAFTHYLNQWLSQPSDKCPIAGKAPYGTAISQRDMDDDYSDFSSLILPAQHLQRPASLSKSIIGLSNDGPVRAAHFRTNHVPLRSQSDYIEAYQASLVISKQISDRTGLKVFAYSVFYPFFSQYKDISRDTMVLVYLTIGVTFVISYVLLGSLRTAIILMLTLVSLTIDMRGLMVMLGISLNALSLVNLVICVGLGVEFCIHIARSFTFVPRVRAIGIRGFTKGDRAYNALAGTGGTVFGGVALTKLIGVSVLAFAHSQIFKLYYFKMWLALAITASLHGLVLLPVALSLWGGSAWLIEDEGAGLVDLEEL